MPGGGTFNRCWAMLAITTLCALAAPSPAGAGTGVGQTFTPPNGDVNLTVLQSGSPGGQYAMPFAGVLTSWSYQAQAVVHPVKLKVARPQGNNPSTNDFTIVGEDGPRDPAASTLNSFPTRISVQPGDVLGLYMGAVGAFFYRGAASSYEVRYTTSDPAVGSTLTFSPGNSIQIDVSAVLEPDADNDGFGDETQDQCPGDASKHDECVPPETVIAKGPKDKTKKKTATFEFSSNESGSTFECSLDDGAFAPCSSPDTVKVKKGKHSFRVRATDPAGNVDGSPAADEWKVKKKKKK